ncbi:YbaK/EbsC family protein [Jiangella gansuensis]|uniref:YbaK/EbsC family protein n=1 Tax=Jiangella gansuensis TaxID=281473 RepID=UPI001B7FA94E|nr:YbaK/EbsC family protein [Jiangella gansuensis]
MTSPTADRASTHPNVQRVRAALEAAGAGGEVVVLPDSAPTAAAAAQQLGCEVGAIANSLVFDCDGAPLLVLTSGAHRADTSLLAAAIGARKVGRATPDFVRAHTGQPIGGVAPLGHPEPVRTLIDTWLARHPRVWAAAGHPHTVFPTTFDELVRVTGGTPVDVEA